MTAPTFTKLGAAVYVNGVDVSKTDVRKHLLEVETALNALFSNPAMLNGKIVVSVGANSLTIAIKTAAGADPSATDPVYVVFRDAALTTAGFVVRAVIAATSLVISAGSTLGGDTSPTVAVGLFDDAGTVRIAASLIAAAGVLYAISATATGIGSSTAEGGAGGADTAAVIYTGTAVASKAFRLVATLTWTTPLGVAGNWSAAPDVVRLIGDSPANLVDITPSGRSLLAGSAGAAAFKYLTADVSGQNIATVQPWFPTAGAVTLPAGTYLFEGLLRMVRAAGVTAHTTGISIGGTATPSLFSVLYECKEGDANDLQDMSGQWTQSQANTTVKASSTSATEHIVVKARGVMTIAAGTVIPQFTFSAVPGGVPTLSAGNYFKLTPLAAASYGSWA